MKILEVKKSSELTELQPISNIARENIIPLAPSEIPEAPC